jgi:hypothetical protein
MTRRLFRGQKGSLRTLTLSTNAFTVGNAQGTFVGNVLNTAPGSAVGFNTLSVANSLQLVLASGVWKIQVGSSAPGSPTALTFNLIETLNGASNTPKTTSGFTVNENAAGGGVLDFSVAADSSLLVAIAA